MEGRFKRVPALDRCFAILDLMVRTKNALGISDLSNALADYKSTLYLSVFEQPANRVFFRTLLE